MRKHFYLFKRLKNILNSNQMKMIHKEIVESIITYGIIDRSSANNTNTH